MLTPFEVEVLVSLGLVVLCAQVSLTGFVGLLAITIASLLALPLPRALPDAPAPAEAPPDAAPDAPAPTEAPPDAAAKAQGFVSQPFQRSSESSRRLCKILFDELRGRR